MTLTAVKNSLVRIAGPGEDGAARQGQGLSSEERREYFCMEDTLLLKDIDVTVEGVGNLSFPLSPDNIKNMIKVSSKAKFGRGEHTILDTSVRDTQVIPAKHLQVTINNDSLSDILERMCAGLNVDSNATLVPHLYNLLIYGRGQFFKMHRDSEKMKNMVATLVILLPSVHKGGELIIQHNNQKHIFFNSKTPEIVKCIMFYSDCQHEIKEVTDGYRIALTYNVVLESPENADIAFVDEGLDSAVLEYFDSDEEPDKLVYLLNHSYSEHSLKWDLLKGSDRSCAMALLAVAKRQGRTPCLALANQNETYDEESGCGLLESSTSLYFWVNENSLPCNETKTDVSEDEMCCTQETKDIFEPYKKEESGPTGNEGETCDYWYRRACVVLWENKWACSNGFKNAIFDLHSLTNSEGNEAKIRSEIDSAGPNFYQKNMWTTAGVCDALIDIVKYINDSAKAIAILSKLSKELLKCDKIAEFLELERQFDNETWLEICNAWKSPLSWKSTLKFMESYVKHADLIKSKVIGPLLDNCVNGFIKSTETYEHKMPLSMYSYNKNSSINCRYIYDKTVDNEISNQLCTLFYLCVVSKKSLLENKLIQHVISRPNVFPSLGLTEIYLRLRQDRPNESEKYKTLYETALLLLRQDLIDLNNHGESWYWPMNIPCGCQFCVKVQSFFHSKTNSKISIPAAAHNRAHVYSFLNPLQSQPLSFSTERSGSPYKIVIEKNKQLLKDRKSLIKKLTDNENKLLVCASSEDNNESSNDQTTNDQRATSSTSQGTNLLEEHTLPTKRMKM